MTLNQTISLLRTYAQSHKQINDFGVETSSSTISDIGAAADQRYPLLWVALDGARYDAKQLSTSLTLVFADLVHTDHKNEIEVQSDMLQVALDTLFFLTQTDTEIEVEPSADIQFFTDRFADLTAGVTIRINIKDPKPFDKCAIPI